MRAKLAVFLFLSGIVVTGGVFAGPKGGHGHDGDKDRGEAGASTSVKPPAWNPSLGKGGNPKLAGGPNAKGRPGGAPHDMGKGGRPRRHESGPFGPFYPYAPVPMTWPYPPYPWSQYYYPYPPQYYPGYSDDDDTGYSTRGLVVPGDLPMGITAYWYYCDTPDGYYPYVKECSHDWTRIPISPPPPGTATPLSYSDWQWCEEKKAFFPYVTSCAAGFEPVPVTVPGKDHAAPPQTANWYFCDDPKGYSPYVMQCARDWRAVPAVPPPSVKMTVKDGKTP